MPRRCHHQFARPRNRIYSNVPQSITTTTESLQPPSRQLFQNFQLSPSPPSPRDLLNTVLHTMSLPLALLFQPGHDAYHQSGSRLHDRSLTTCWSWESYDHRLVAGHLPSTWCRRNPLVIGVHAVTTEHSTVSLPPTGIQYHISRISPFHSTAPASSRRLIWFGHTIRARRHPQDGCHYPIRTLRVSTHAIRSSQRCANLPTFYRSGLRRLPYCYQYIDDLLVASDSPEEHQQHLRQVLQRLSEHGIIINPSKCEFGITELDFLGYRVSSQGIQPLQERVKAVKDFPTPM